jgi:hypothetical protein
MADISPLGQKFSLRIKDLNAPVLSVTNIHKPLCIRGNGVGELEFAFT